MLLYDPMIVCYRDSFKEMSALWYAIKSSKLDSWNKLSHAIKFYKDILCQMKNDIDLSKNKKHQILDIRKPTRLPLGLHTHLHLL